MVLIGFYLFLQFSSDFECFFIDIFDDFFRYMVQIFEEYTDFNEDQFWQVLATTIRDYQDSCPHLAEKFEQYDIFQATFKLSCLNRLQINNNRKMIDLDDPEALLQFTGELSNPLAQFKPVKNLAAS